MDGSRSEILLCFPAAGGGPSFFAPWSETSSVFDVVAVDLPGKEKLLFDEPADSIPGLARAVLPAVRAAVAGRHRITLFGHCFGAIVAYELARLLELEDPARDVVLFASGSAAPGEIPWTRAAALPDAGLLHQIGLNAGESGTIPEDPELRELILPALRADVTAHESYEPPAGPLASCSVVTVRGEHDALVSAGAAARWRTFTTGRFGGFELPGGHMYLTERWGPLLAHMEKELGDHA
ncbi:MULTISPECIES: alpha/beta fold hydrolase [unclassified Streptomyces]|uniref:thioesterase II family protein n=1 Tax=unclassified Streptomyces TaxID=2593676 RepID=UPI003326D1C5